VIVAGGSPRGVALATVRLRRAGLEVDLQAEWGPGVVGLLVDPERTVRDRELARCDDLKAIATASVGYDHLKVAGTAARGVTVCNVPDYCVEEVADSTLAMLLDLLRGVTVADRDVRNRLWRVPAAPMRRIAGTRLGLVGFGAIARQVAAKAQALGMDVKATDTAPATGRAQAVPLVGLEELLGQSHAVTLHAPLTKASRGMIGAEELARLPSGAVLVNTARGGLLDLDALLRALEEGRLSGAALDVLPEEPPGREPPSHPHLVLTPHCAWYSRQAEAAAYQGAAEAIIAVLGGKHPSTALSPEVLADGGAA